MTDQRANIFPTMRYGDARAAIEWLGRAFGFQPGLAVPDGADRVAHAELSLGAGHIMLGSERDDPANPWAKERIGLYVCVDDIDAHYARARAAGAEIVREIADTDYGAREYSVRDLEGYLWSFGTYRPEPPR